MSAAKLFAITVKDAPGADRLREEHREGHLDHFRAHKPAIALSGPLKDEDGNPVGSLVILAAQSEGAAREFIEADPFHAAGVWAEVNVAALSVSIFDPDRFVS